MKIALRQLEGRSPGYWALVAVLAVVSGIGLLAAWTMEHHGHIITGMNNQIVWGIPHVFAVFLVVAASGALNVASMASVFGKTAYKPLAPLSALLAIALLAGGLAVLMLDLGRPDRLIVAMTYYNFKSIFAWNVVLYSGFMGIVVAYLWTMMEHRMNAYSTYAGLSAFVWRLALTTGTGSIFGFLIGRQAFGSALMGPMFIVYSLSYGLAIFLLVLLAVSRWTERPLEAAMQARLTRLLAVFVACAAYFVLVYHLTNLYFAKQHGLERFLLLDGGLYTRLFWLGQLGLGSLLPLVLLLAPRTRNSRAMLVLAALAVIAGGLAQMYVTIIGSQAWPLQIFPGYEVSSSFYDGVVGSYTPSLPEWLLGIGGIGMTGIIVVLALKWLAFLPQRLDQFPPDAVAGNAH
ncbi:NrfD/PsrC family molybdoenzyme membrane anchor subunit [Curvibacter sp. PAE-UM]|uniref:NrfD/PsrC family molybdoenzyme membrane anchor subunit n=1 Tax=Curvibacter sp. PAE-UM TaxID=1714344 RepID=UPI00070E9079|nr:NrfD/PsrC family molybdoenzyme membrane anchor subunit [Curvibacter sp. PAE-UM]KRI00116.1 molybdopterin oxidoreductase [Curvibacter sp. PAE-UM]